MSSKGLNFINLQKFILLFLSGIVYNEVVLKCSSNFIFEPTSILRESDGSEADVRPRLSVENRN